MQCKATLRSALIVSPRRHQLHEHASGSGELSATPATDSTSMPPGRVSHSFTPVTDSMSMPPGRASYSVTPSTDSTSKPPGWAR
eukprot:3722299-Rhodomonas_salina.1